MTTVLATTMREAFLDAVADAVDGDERVALVLADISADAGPVPALTARHPDRVINVGIREQLMVGVAGGLALAGLRPVVHSYAPFLVERPYEALKLDLGHQDVGAVLVSIGASYDAGAAGRTHEAPEDVALLDTLPGWTVHVPGHPDEAAHLVREAALGDGRAGDGQRVYVRLSEATNAEPHHGAGFQVVRGGTEGVVVAVGPTLDTVLEAVDRSGRDLAVVYTATPRPFDAAGLRAAVEKSAPVVVTVEPYLAGTSARAVAEALDDRPHRYVGLGTRRSELRRYGTRAEHDAAHGLDEASLCERFVGL